MDEIWIIEQETKYGTDVILLSDKPTRKQLDEMTERTKKECDLSEVFTNITRSMAVNNIPKTKSYLKGEENG